MYLNAQKVAAVSFCLPLLFHFIFLLQVQFILLQRIRHHHSFKHTPICYLIYLSPFSSPTLYSHYNCQFFFLGEGVRDWTRGLLTELHPQSFFKNIFWDKSHKMAELPFSCPSIPECWDHWHVTPHPASSLYLSLVSTSTSAFAVLNKSILRYFLISWFFLPLSNVAK